MHCSFYSCDICECHVEACDDEVVVVVVVVVDASGAPPN